MLEYIKRRIKLKILLEWAWVGVNAILTFAFSGINETWTIGTTIACTVLSIATSGQQISTKYRFMRDSANFVQQVIPRVQIARISKPVLVPPLITTSMATIIVLGAWMVCLKLNAPFILNVVASTALVAIPPLTKEAINHLFSDTISFFSSLLQDGVEYHLEEVKQQLLNITKTGSVNQDMVVTCLKALLREGDVEKLVSETYTIVNVDDGSSIHYVDGAASSAAAIQPPSPQQLIVSSSVAPAMTAGPDYGPLVQKVSAVTEMIKKLRRQYQEVSKKLEASEGIVIKMNVVKDRMNLEIIKQQEAADNLTKQISRLSKPVQQRQTTDTDTQSTAIPALSSVQLPEAACDSAISQTFSVNLAAAGTSSGFSAGIAAQSTPPSITTLTQRYETILEMKHELQQQVDKLKSSLQEEKKQQQITATVLTQLSAANERLNRDMQELRDMRNWLSFPLPAILSIMFPTITGSLPQMRGILNDTDFGKIEMDLAELAPENDGNLAERLAAIKQQLQDETSTTVSASLVALQTQLGIIKTKLEELCNKQQATALTTAAQVETASPLLQL